MNTSFAAEWTEVNESETHIRKRAPLTIRTPAELLGMYFDDSDKILGDRVLAKSQSLTLLGEGGLGKSRLFLQFVASVNTGREFIGLPTFGGPYRVLLMQTENSNRRLQADLLNLQRWLGKDWPAVNDNLHIHTLETDEDAMVRLDNPNNRAEADAAVQKLKPDIIGWDTLAGHGFGNLNSDEDMINTCQAIGQVSKAGNPDRGIVVLHHATTGRASAAKATGFDRSSFGRNSKALHSWTRAQINFAPGNEEKTVLVVACGKNNNGKEFPTFAIRLNPDSMIYEPDPHFDLSAWETDVAGKTAFKPMVTTELVISLCDDRITKPKLVKALMEQTGCSKSRAYQAIEEAETDRRIFFCKVRKDYAKKL